MSIDPRSFWLGVAAAYVVSLFASALVVHVLRRCAREVPFGDPTDTWSSGDREWTATQDPDVIPFPSHRRDAHQPPTHGRGA